MISIYSDDKCPQCTCGYVIEDFKKLAGEYGSFISCPNCGERIALVVKH